MPKQSDDKDSGQQQDPKIIREDTSRHGSDPPKKHVDFAEPTEPTAQKVMDIRPTPEPDEE